jgi:hypothetical protein
MRGLSRFAFPAFIVALGIAASGSAAAGRVDTADDTWWQTDTVMSLDFSAPDDRLEAQLTAELLYGESPFAGMEDGLRRRMALDLLINVVRDSDIAPPEIAFRRRRLVLLWLWRQRQQEQIDSPAPLALMLFGGLALAYHRRRR